MDGLGDDTRIMIADSTRNWRLTQNPIILNDLYEIINFFMLEE